MSKKLLRRIVHNWKTTSFFRSYFPKELCLIYRVNQSTSTRYYSNAEKAVRSILPDFPAIDLAKITERVERSTKEETVSSPCGNNALVTKIEVK